MVILPADLFAAGLFQLPPAGDAARAGPDVTPS